MDVPSTCLQPRFENLVERKLFGMRITMSITNNKTAELWSNFMPLRKTIDNRLSADLISLQVYGPDYYHSFNPSNEFEKWALVEVPDFSNIPEEMEPFTLVSGLYAVFDYIGSSTDPSIFQYIYSDWLPKSGYQLDNRPHFEVLGQKYRNNDPNSEEEIWIPIKG